jgi:hypothetical protein
VNQIAYLSRCASGLNVVGGATQSRTGLTGFAIRRTRF